MCHPPLMLSPGNPLEHEPVDELTGKAHPHAHTGSRRLGLLLRDEVVKSPIQMRQRNINQNPRHGKLRGNRPDCFRPPLARLLARRTSRGHTQVLAGKNDERRRAEHVVEEH